MLDWLPAIVRLIARWWPPNCSIQGVVTDGVPTKARKYRSPPNWTPPPPPPRAPPRPRPSPPPRPDCPIRNASSPPMISVTLRNPSLLSAVARSVFTAARCGGVRSASSRPSRWKMPTGRLDHRVFCGPSKGNWTFAFPASSSVATTACAAATMRAVVSEAGAGLAPRCANPTAATAKHKPNDRIETIRTGVRMLESWF